MSPARGHETKSNGQPAPREFSTGDAHRHAPLNGSWWANVPASQFGAVARQQQARMTHSSTSYSQQVQTEAE